MVRPSCVDGFFDFLAWATNTTSDEIRGLQSGQVQHCLLYTSLTALAFVGVVIALSRAISPRSYNLQKFEAYECVIPTRGKSWMQFRVGSVSYTHLDVYKRQH